MYAYMHTLYARGSGRKTGRDTPSEPDLDNASVGKLKDIVDLYIYTFHLRFPLPALN